MSETNKSEVARLREQIALEYHSAKRVFTDFTPTAQHEYITKRQENIAIHFAELKQQIGEKEAMHFMMQLEMGTQNISFPKTIS
jgi:hypothetical protein